ncbi:DUF4382 domain-containing protein [Myxococcus sp. AM009]|uniref:DUF4382 domain-containing protein n=1 Tax=unclassified Myxococcus TaxID=2648731 RepID=UPI0015960671|nr:MULTISPECIES: DUF4382 domain-containing protein [unclassified Myxococcus]NVI97430.1 DUF4382 domain-containing protein [Myxococcus sp. AM009]NVJ15136.1 DUF4382 domain-containing protein [Myxococcus sp. AM010]
MTLRSRLLALLPIALLPLMACGGNEGKVTLLLTDAPGDDLRTAVVTISEIYLQGGDDGRVVLRDSPATVNLLELANSTSELVSEAVVPNGDYSELRFVITGGYIEVANEDGSSTVFASSADYAGLPAGTQVGGQLHMPSYGASGLKVKFSEKLTIEGEQKVLLVDFDVGQSFGKEAGNSGRWVMSPVIKSAEMTASGSIRVTADTAATVALPVVDGRQVTLGDFSAVMTNEAGSRERLALADADGDGTYDAVFKFLIPGTFTVQLEPPASVSASTAPEHPVTVDVGSGRDVAHHFTIMGATRQ